MLLHGLMVAETSKYILHGLDQPFNSVASRLSSARLAVPNLLVLPRIPMVEGLCWANQSLRQAHVLEMLAC